MPNNYFQFKQFLIKQDKCAMKVCTDACLFGAWVARSSQLAARSLLDIGTGTGLLSLMYAQKNSDIIIDAVEIDEAAAQQARENFEASSWKERLNVYETSIQQFANSPVRQLKYDVIISNPPFYESDLKSENDKKNLALHSTDLKLEELINIADELLHNNGNFFVLLPYHRISEFEKLSAEIFFVKEKVLIKQTSKHSYFRSMLWLTKYAATTIRTEVTIMHQDGKYTNGFAQLLKDYYLSL